VRREVSSLGIHYPVVTDNDYATWKAYNVEAWPTIVCWISWDEFAGGTLVKEPTIETEGVSKSFWPKTTSSR